MTDKPVKVPGPDHPIAVTPAGGRVTAPGGLVLAADLPLVTGRGLVASPT